MIFVEVQLDTPVLQAALTARTDVVVTVEEKRALPSGVVRFLFWACTEDFDTFETALADDPTVKAPSVLHEVEDKRLYRVELTEEGKATTVHQAYVELDAVLLEGKGTRDGWFLQMRFPDHATFKEFRQRCDDVGVEVDLYTIYNQTESSSGDPIYNLTECQQDALVAAYDMGYFEIPRNTSLADLASELGVSSQATSERLRRGTERLVRHSLAEQASHRSG
ncbi:helix-turn-helix domain-containing protein [Haladaptatus sp. GCM10025707]|uniref:helix-turn-helix domain-containing protein n=1 Tax=unclassified Haladaptatus TaxID=2622732 RepID=UPI0023E78B04|nr:helix-turn-helix domain-containing protein [Haladaptatus sp. QDMS2]